MGVLGVSSAFSEEATDINKNSLKDSLVVSSDEKALEPLKGTTWEISKTINKTTSKERPIGANEVNKTSNPLGAPVYMGNVVTGGNQMELSVDFPAYNKPVNIWILIELPDGRFYVVDESNQLLNLDSSGFVPIAAGVSGKETAETILEPFEVGSVVTAFDPYGMWNVYWLIAPSESGIDLIKAIENGNYELGYYSFTILRPIEEPVNPPSNLTARAISQSQINIAWQDNSNYETGFNVFRKNGQSGSYTKIGTVGVNVSTYNDAGLSPDTTYYYKVTSLNAISESDYSNEVSSTTPFEPVNPPSAITARAISQSQINIAWQDNSSNETGFNVFRKTGQSGSYEKIGSVGVNVSTYNDSGLSPNTTYYYKVTSFNTTSESADSNIVSATTLSPPEPPKPTGTNLFQCDITTESYGFEIIGESGQVAITYNSESTSYQYSPSGQRTGLTVGIDRTLTYTNSKNSYNIVGKIVLNEINNTVKYDVTATGSALKDGEQTCKN